MGYETVLINRYKDLEEISIRQEVEDFFTGFDYGEAKENIFVIKKSRRNRNFVRKECPMCHDPIRNEGKKGCPNCDGTGFQYDEDLILGHMAVLQSKRLVQNLTYIDNPGRTTEVMFVFYTRYNDHLYEGDVLLKPILTSEGFIDWPLAYSDKYIVTSKFNYRLDEGRSEYNFYSTLKI